MLSDRVVQNFIEVVFTFVKNCQLCFVDRYYFNLSVEVRVCVCQTFKTAGDVVIVGIVNDFGCILVAGFICLVTYRMATGAGFYLRRTFRSDGASEEPAVAYENIYD